jgi:hypothetical protein
LALQTVDPTLNWFHSPARQPVLVRL